MPTNVYGPGDNFDLEKSHVLAALIRKVHEAKLRNQREVTIWGTGTPRREFLHSDDLADALRFLLENYASPEIINVGCGEDLTIRELVEIIARVIGFEIDLVFDTTKPDGTPRKLLDTTRLQALGWRPRIPLSEGIRQTYHWFLESSAQLRGCENGGHRKRHVVSFDSRVLRIAISSHSGCGNTTATNNVGRTLGLDVVNYTFRDLAQDLQIPFEDIQRRAAKSRIYDFLTDLKLMRTSLRALCRRRIKVGRLAYRRRFAGLAARAARGSGQKNLSARG